MNLPRIFQYKDSILLSMKFLILTLALSTKYVATEQNQYNGVTDYPTKCQYTNLLCNESRLLKQDKIIILNIANDMRNRIAAGKFHYLNLKHDPVSNMNKLSWDEKLAEKAKNIVELCPNASFSFINQTTTIVKGKNGIDHIKIENTSNPSDHHSGNEMPECEVSTVTYAEKLTICAPQKIKERLIAYLAEGGLSAEGRNYDMRDFWILKRNGKMALTFRRAESSNLGCSYMIRAGKTHYFSYLTCIHCSYNGTLPIIGHAKEKCAQNFSKTDSNYKNLCSDSLSEYRKIISDPIDVRCKKEPMVSTTIATSSTASVSYITSSRSRTPPSNVNTTTAVSSETTNPDIRSPTTTSTNFTSVTLSPSVSKTASLPMNTIVVSSFTPTSEPHTTTAYTHTRSEKSTVVNISSSTYSHISTKPTYQTTFQPQSSLIRRTTCRTTIPSSSPIVTAYPNRTSQTPTIPHFTPTTQKSPTSSVRTSAHSNTQTTPWSIFTSFSSFKTPSAHTSKISSSSRRSPLTSIFSHTQQKLSSTDSSVHPQSQTTTVPATGTSCRTTTPSSNRTKFPSYHTTGEKPQSSASVDYTTLRSYPSRNYTLTSSSLSSQQTQNYSSTTTTLDVTTSSYFPVTSSIRPHLKITTTTRLTSLQPNNRTKTTCRTITIQPTVTTGHENSTSSNASTESYSQTIFGYRTTTSVSPWPMKTSVTIIPKPHPTSKLTYQPRDSSKKISTQPSYTRTMVFTSLQTQPLNNTTATPWSPTLTTIPYAKVKPSWSSVFTSRRTTTTKKVETSKSTYTYKTTCRTIITNQTKPSTTTVTTFTNHTFNVSSTSATFPSSLSESTIFSTKISSRPYSRTVVTTNQTSGSTQSWTPFTFVTSSAVPLSRTSCRTTTVRKIDTSVANKSQSQSHTTAILITSPIKNANKYNFSTLPHTSFKAINKITTRPSPITPIFKRTEIITTASSNFSAMYKTILHKPKTSSIQISLHPHSQTIVKAQTSTFAPTTSRNPLFTTNCRTRLSSMAAVTSRKFINKSSVSLPEKLRSLTTTSLLSHSPTTAFTITQTIPRAKVFTSHTFSTASCSRSRVTNTSSKAPSESLFTAIASYTPRKFTTSSILTSKCWTTRKAKKFSIQPEPTMFTTENVTSQTSISKVSNFPTSVSPSPRTTCQSIFYTSLSPQSSIATSTHLLNLENTTTPTISAITLSTASLIGKQHHKTTHKFVTASFRKSSASLSRSFSLPSHTTTENTVISRMSMLNFSRKTSCRTTHLFPIVSTVRSHSENNTTRSAQVLTTSQHPFEINRIPARIQNASGILNQTTCRTFVFYQREKTNPATTFTSTHPPISSPSQTTVQKNTFDSFSKWRFFSTKQSPFDNEVTTQANHTTEHSILQSTYSKPFSSSVNYTPSRRKFNYNKNYRHQPCICINWYVMSLIFSVAFLFAWCLLCWQRVLLM